MTQAWTKEHEAAFAEMSSGGTEESKRARVELGLARADAQKLMQDMVDLHRKAADALQEYVARFKQAAMETDAQKRSEGAMRTSTVDVMSWFVNEVNNARSQGRLDLFVSYAARLGSAENRAAQIKKGSK